MIGRLRVVTSSSRMAVRRQFAAVPPWMWVVQIAIVNLFQMAFFVYVTTYADNPDISVAYVALGNAVQSIAMVTVYSVSNLPTTEKHTGTMTTLMSTPTRLSSVFFGMALFQIVAGVMSVSISLIYASFLFGVDFSDVNMLSMIVTIGLTSYSMFGLGFILCSMGLYFRTSFVVAKLVMYVSMVLCGVNFPISYLPEPLRYVSAVLPLTYGVEGVRQAAVGAPLTSIGFELGAMVILGTSLLAISLWMMAKFERMVLVKGRLDVF